ncbi:MAG: zf-TFIIB domain-containing protein [Pseudomonadota bacterium]
MQCPKCDDTMLPVEFGTEIKVMRCPGCGGILCRAGELQKLRSEWLVDTVLDTGNTVEGLRQNEIRDIDCPDCDAKMVRIQDTEQTHITLDSCQDCGSTFLDAGELTDLKNVTLVDHVRRLLSLFNK